jgi:hypothetical protein
MLKDKNCTRLLLYSSHIDIFPVIVFHVPLSGVFFYTMKTRFQTESDNRFPPYPVYNYPKQASQPKTLGANHKSGLTYIRANSPPFQQKQNGFIRSNSSTKP